MAASCRTQVGHRQTDRETHLCDNADEQLFDNVRRNSHHTLHNLLPPESLASQNYSLRSPAHNRQLPEHFNHLDDSNFIICMLYKNMY